MPARAPIRTFQAYGHKEAIPAGQATDHFKAFPFITLDITMHNADTRQFLSWEPTHPGLIADLENGHYFHRRLKSPRPASRHVMALVASGWRS
jgi:hypothetical protein